MSGISLRGVSKRFGEVPVIDGLNLEIRDGEFFTFVGPSGCGKSTILNLIAGLESVSSGTILFDGREVNPLTPQERDVAMVFQSYALYPHFTVEQNISFPLIMKKVDKKNVAAEVRRVASLLGLEGMLRRKPRELSGGQRQRVALGRAIIRHPRVFLLDEPLSNLDARLRVEMRAELKKLHQELKITTVYVTHDQAEALSMSQRLAVLREGRVQQCAAPAEVYRRPANLFVAGFIGSPPINLVPALVSRPDPPQVECLGMKISPCLEGPLRKGRVVLGLRPEDIAVSRGEAGDALSVRVTLVEPAGSYSWVGVNWNDVHVRGVAAIEDDLQPGDPAGLRWTSEKLLVFDETTGERIP